MSYADLQTQAKNALDAVIASMPVEGKTLSTYLAGLHRKVEKDTLILGEDEAFALRDSTGEIKAFKQRLTLSLENGGLVQPVFNGPHVVSAQGYEKWAEAAGTCVIFPKSVIVDGVEQANPHREIDPANGRTKSIYARAVAFRFSSKGLPMVADWTTAYDVPSYRLIDLIAKASKNPQAFKLLPSDMGKPEEKGTWARYPFDESTSLWVDTSHKEALDWYKTIINREKKAMDFAQTFARRNACKHLSGLQKAPGPVWNIPVICWRPTGGSIVKWDSTTYANIQRRIEGLGEGQDFAALTEGEKPVTIQYAKGVDRMEEELPLVDAEDEDREPEAAPLDMAPGQNGTYDHASEKPAQAATPDPAPERPAAPVLSEADRKALANYHTTRENFPGEDAEARRRLGIHPDADVTPSQAQELYRIASAIVDGDAQ
ncbi:hypothetical protein [Solidesulfovibrio sp.]